MKIERPYDEYGKVSVHEIPVGECFATDAGLYMRTHPPVCSCPPIPGDVHVVNLSNGESWGMGRDTRVRPREAIVRVLG